MVMHLNIGTAKIIIFSCPKFRHITKYIQVAIDTKFSLVNITLCYLISVYVLDFTTSKNYDKECPLDKISY